MSEEPKRNAEPDASRGTLSGSECPDCGFVLVHIADGWHCIPCKMTFEVEWRRLGAFSGSEDVNRWARIARGYTSHTQPQRLG